MINKTLRDDNVDFILDASNYAKPVALLCIACPDNLLLNIGLSSKQAIELASRDLPNGTQAKKGMVTANLMAYYMSLCNTFGAMYTIDKYMDHELIPAAVMRQQLN